MTNEYRGVEFDLENYSHIVMTEDTLGGKPRVEGHRIGVNHIYHSYQRYESIEKIAEDVYPSLSEEEVEQALRFFRDNRKEIVVALMRSTFANLDTASDKMDCDLEPRIEYLEHLTQILLDEDDLEELGIKLNPRFQGMDGRDLIMWTRYKEWFDSIDEFKKVRRSDKPVDEYANEKRREEQKSEEFKFFLNNDLSEYEGEWIAISGSEILAHNESEEEVRKAVEDVEEKVLISKVPRSDVVRV